MRARRRKHDMILQLCEEQMPERVQLVHIQHARDTDRSPLRFILRQNLPVKEQVVLEIVHVRQVFSILLLADAPFTPVSGDEGPSAGEMVHCQPAVICAALALGIVCCILERTDLTDREHGSLFPFLIALPCDQTGSKRAHDACNVRADGFTAGNFLERSQNAIVVEGSALADDVAAKLFGIRNLNDLVQSIFYD